MGKGSPSSVLTSPKNPKTPPPHTYNGSNATLDATTPMDLDSGSRGVVTKRGGTSNVSSKQMICKVMLLDDSVVPFQVPYKSVSKVLFDQICQSLNLLETDYFGVEYFDNEGNKCWLDNEKFIINQVGMSGDVIFKFCVKFYTPDPTQLEEEYTRYLFCLQLKRDLADGSMPCSENTTALLASYIVQADCGDYSYEDYPDHTYLSGIQFVPKQTSNLEIMIMDNHKKHAGQTPAEADLNFLDIARRVEMYGIKMHPAQDHEGVGLNLAVAHMGILVYQNMTRINTFSWAKIRKLSFKRKKFLIKLHPEEYGYYKDTVEFYFQTRNQSKNFWKKCIEHHTFFRVVNNFPISAEKPNVRHKRAKIFSKGSSFRYSGRTQKEIVAFVRDSFINRQPFTRSLSSHLSIKSAASPNSQLKSSSSTGADTGEGTGLGQTLATPAGVPYYGLNNVRSETRLSKASSTSGSHMFDTSAEDVTMSLQNKIAPHTSLADRITDVTRSPSIPNGPPLLAQSSQDGSLSVSFTQNDTTAPIVSEMEEEILDEEPIPGRKISRGEQRDSVGIIAKGNFEPRDNIHFDALLNKNYNGFATQTIPSPQAYPTDMAHKQPQILHQGERSSLNRGTFSPTTDRKGSLPQYPLHRFTSQRSQRASEGHIGHPFIPPQSITKSKTSLTGSTNTNIPYDYGDNADQTRLPYRPTHHPSLIQYDPTSFVETYAYNVPHSHSREKSSSERLLSIGGSNGFNGSGSGGVPKDERVEIRTSNVMVTKITEKDDGYNDMDTYYHYEPTSSHGISGYGDNGGRDYIDTQQQHEILQRNQLDPERNMSAKGSEAYRRKSENIVQGKMEPNRRATTMVSPYLLPTEEGDIIHMNVSLKSQYPPQEERGEDVLPLMHHYIERFDNKLLFDDPSVMNGNNIKDRGVVAKFKADKGLDMRRSHLLPPNSPHSSTNTEEDTSSKSYTREEERDEETDLSISSSSSSSRRGIRGKNGKDNLKAPTLIRGLDKETIAAQQKKLLEEDIPYVLHVRNQHHPVQNHKRNLRQAQAAPLAQSHRQSSSESFGYYDTAFEEQRGGVPTFNTEATSAAKLAGSSATDIWHPQHIHDGGGVTNFPKSPINLNQRRNEDIHFDKASSISDLPYKMSLVCPVLSHLKRTSNHRLPTSSAGVGGASLSLSHIPTSSTTCLGGADTANLVRLPATPQPLRRHLTDEEIRSTGLRSSYSPYSHTSGHGQLLQHLPHFTFDLVRLSKLPSKTSFSSLDHTVEPLGSCLADLILPNNPREGTYMARSDGDRTFSPPANIAEEDNSTEIIDEDECLILAALARSETNVATADIDNYPEHRYRARQQALIAKKNLRRSLSNPCRTCPSALYDTVGVLPTTGNCYHSDYYHPSKKNITSASTTQLLRMGSGGPSAPFSYIDEDHHNNGANSYVHCRKDWFARESPSPTPVQGKYSSVVDRDRDRMAANTSFSKDGKLEASSQTYSTVGADDTLSKRKKTRHRKTRSRSRTSHGVKGHTATTPKSPTLSSSSSSSTSSSKSISLRTRGETSNTVNPTSNPRHTPRTYVPLPRPVPPPFPTTLIDPLDLDLKNLDQSDCTHLDHDQRTWSTSRGTSGSFYEGLEEHADPDRIEPGENVGPDYNSITEGDGYSDITIF